MDKRGLQTTGFQDSDREILQKAFDEDFKQDLEAARARRREAKRRSARQAGLQRRRMAMERLLQEEEDNLAKNNQTGLLVALIKANKMDPSIRVDLNSVGCRSLAKALWDNTTVTCLDLSSNDLNDHAGSYLARILKRNNTIAKLELDNNLFGPNTCLAFSEALKVNKSLVYLSLDSNPLTSGGTNYNGFIEFVKSLRYNSTLKSLNLWRVGAGSQGGQALASSIRANHTLLFCDISHNSIDMIDVKKIADQLDMNLGSYASNERSRRNDEAKETEREAKFKKQEEVLQCNTLFASDIIYTTIFCIGRKKRGRSHSMVVKPQSGEIGKSHDGRGTSSICCAVLSDFIILSLCTEQYERQVAVQAAKAEKERKEAEIREAERKAQEEAEAKKKKKNAKKK